MNHILKKILKITIPCLAVIPQVIVIIKHCWPSNQFAKAIKTLSANKQFVFVPLDISKSEQKRFENFDINQNETFERYGNLELLQTEIRDFLAKLGNNRPQEIQKISATTCRLIRKVVSESKQETAWVVVRATTPNNQFDIPRWHTDGNYYSPYNIDSHPKFAMTLKGPGTLFYPATAQEREIIEDRNAIRANHREQDLKNREKNREYLAAFCDTKKIVQQSRSQGAFFCVGNQHAAVHSEPPIKTPRLFVALVLGSEEQIKELEKLHKQSNPTPPKNELSNKDKSAIQEEMQKVLDKTESKIKFEQLPEIDLCEEDDQGENEQQVNVNLSIKGKPIQPDGTMKKLVRCRTEQYDTFNCDIT